MFMKVQRVIFCLLEKLEIFVNCKQNDSSFKKCTKSGYQISRSYKKTLNELQKCMFRGIRGCIRWSGLVVGQLAPSG